MSEAACVGALIRDDRNRVFVHRRSPERRLLPGVWDIVGGHVESGESPEEALAREIEEETGWGLRRIEAMVSDWRWEFDGTVRSERDFPVEVDGDLTSPRLESGKHDAFAWVGPDDLDLMLRTDGDRQLRDIVAKATRIRLTDRLRLEPLGPEHVDDLLALHRDPGVAAWFDGPWSKPMRSSERPGPLTRGRTWVPTGGWPTSGPRGPWWGEEGLRWPTWMVPTVWRWVGWCARTLGGRGYATEMGRAGLDFAFAHLGADEVVAFTEPHNERSRAVMSRLGMRFSREIAHADRSMVLYVRRPAD